jgi:hypothetical protein
MKLRTRYLTVPENRDYPLKKPLYTICRSTRRSPAKESQPVHSKPINLRGKRKQTLSDLTKLLKDRFSFSPKYYRPETHRPASASSKPSDIERLATSSQPRRVTRRVSSLTSRSSTTLRRDVDKASKDNLEASKTLLSTKVSQFVEFILASETRTQLSGSKKVREIVNLPKFPFGKHSNIPSRGFVREHIRETESSEWLNINHSTRKSPGAKERRHS